MYYVMNNEEQIKTMYYKVLKNFIYFQITKNY